MWKTLPGASEITRAAQVAFPARASNIRVSCNEQHQVLIECSPYGRIELVRVSQGYVAAAQNPPRPCVDPSVLPEQLAKHFQAIALVPWRVIHQRDICSAIHSLASEGPNPCREAGTLSSPLLCPITSSSRLVGESRRRCAERIAGVVAAQRFPGPLVQIAGREDGIGKRTMAGNIARWMDWRVAGELPLGRFAVDRALQTRAENVLDAILTLHEESGADTLLVCGDAELLPQLGNAHCAVLLRELARLPHVILLAKRPIDRVEGIVAFDCPALESTVDAREMVADECPGVVFAGASFDLLSRAASVRGKGIIPGRLLYLIGLAKRLLNSPPSDLPPETTGISHSQVLQGDGLEGCAGVVLAPDEVTTAIEIARSVWSNTCDDTE